MASVNIASGKSINRMGAEVADINNSYHGVAGGVAETLIIDMQVSDGALLLQGQTARFDNVAMKVNGTAGNDVFTGTDNAESVFGLAGNDNLSGNGGNDTLDGGAGNDVLDGGTGNDKMIGGAGNDTYIVDSTGDTVTEGANGGIDLVKSSINFALGANLENLTLTGDDDIKGIGNALANRIIGNDGNNFLSGLAGNDVLIGGNGDDTLDGGLGNDVMTGGSGDDTYIVNSISDKVVEDADGGTDTVNSSVSFKLGSNIENLTLTGTGVINGTGNGLDNEITGNAKANILTGGAGDDTLDGGAGNDTLVGGTGDDTYILDSVGDKITENVGEGNDTVVTNFSYALGDNVENLVLTGDADINGDGNDSNNEITGNDGVNVLDGGAGDDILDGNDGNDVLIGGDGNDELSGGDGDDILLGGDGDDTLDGGDGDDYLSGGGGDNTFIISEGEDTIIAGAGSDTFVFNAAPDDDVVIDGGTSGGASPNDTDSTITNTLTGLNTSTGGTPASGNVNNTLGTANATDTILFNASGDYSEVGFTHIEKIQLASGVSITLSNEQLDDAFDSLNYGPGAAYNPGLHFYGVAGGPTETVNVLVEYENLVFTPAATIVGATPISYIQGDLQFDDADIGNLFHDVDLAVDMFTNSTTVSYARYDGSNNAETVNGSRGVDNVDGRLGDDTYFGNSGNDKLTGQGGADTLDGGDGNDIFLVTSFSGTDGNPEWIATGASHDLIIGGDGIDTFRITGATGATSALAGTVVLNDANFQSMEVVEIGATVGRLNVENSALQLIDDHFYQNTAGTFTNGNNVVVDASGVTANGLTFIGNGNNNTFIGTTQDDTFIGNGGNDTLTGGSGSDTFVFGQVHTQTVTGAATVVQTYTDVATNLTGSDTITDFSSGTDHLSLDHAQYASLTGITDVTANLVQGAGAVAADANDFLVFDTTSGVLYYDADADGAGAAVSIATLTGVASLAAADFTVT